VHHVSLYASEYQPPVSVFHTDDGGFYASTQPAMSSRAYRDGGVLVPTEHHIGEFHAWVSARLA
jgi:Rieske 2Fe-2S family protein